MDSPPKNWPIQQRRCRPIVETLSGNHFVRGLYCGLFGYPQGPLTNFFCDCSSQKRKTQEMNKFAQKLIFFQWLAHTDEMKIQSRLIMWVFFLSLDKCDCDIQPSTNPQKLYPSLSLLLLPRDKLECFSLFFSSASLPHI